MSLNLTIDSLLFFLRRLVSCVYNARIRLVESDIVCEKILLKRKTAVGNGSFENENGFSSYGGF
jgi:hypothetical protein